MAQLAAIDAARGGETLVVLTADHGGTWGEQFEGKTTLDASSSNWYYGPTGLWDGTTFVPGTSATYNTPSQALAPLIATGNIQFSYQSTALEAWLLDRSLAQAGGGHHRPDPARRHCGLLPRRRRLPPARPAADGRRRGAVVAPWASR